MKTGSIFKKLLLRILGTSLIPFVCFMLIVSGFVCGYFKSLEISRLKEQTDDYVTVTKALVNRAITAADCIQRYPVILTNINKRFKDVYEVYDFVDVSNIYIDNVTEGAENSSFVIYFSNEHLFEGKYFHGKDNLRSYDTLLKEFEKRGQNFIWDEKIHEDENGNKCIYFYKKFPLVSNDILECSITLPEQINGIRIFTGSQLNDIPENLIVSPINEYFSAGIYIDSGNLYLKYTIIIFATFLIIAVITLFISAVAFMVMKKTTNGITGFINQLDTEDILESQSNINFSEEEGTELITIKKTIVILFNKIKDIEIEKKNVEIELIQSKINPHTMYNSLSAIRLKAYEMKETEIVELVDVLSEYYRMVLNKGQNVTLICNEINMLQKYVSVNELSNYSNYEFVADVPDDLKRCRIPHLILLPLVENSLIHGLAGKREGGRIELVCRRQGQHLIVTIIDNGSGISPDKLAQLNDPLNSDVGYGIKNVCQRLRLIYGSQSHVRIESVPMEGTKITLNFVCFDENGKEII